MTDDPRIAARLRLRSKIGPHKQVGETRITDVPAQHGVMAHRDYQVTTACGQEVSTTLATRRDDLVRCPNCLAAMEAEDQ